MLSQRINHSFNPFSDEVVSEYKKIEMFIILQKIFLGFLPLILLLVVVLKDRWFHSNWGVLILLFIVIVNLYSYSRWKYVIVESFSFQVLTMGLIDWCIFEVSAFGSAILLSHMLWAVCNSLVLEKPKVFLLFVLMALNSLVVGYLLPRPAGESWLFAPLILIFFAGFIQAAIIFCLQGFENQRARLSEKLSFVRDFENDLLLGNIDLKSKLYQRQHPLETLPKLDAIISMVSNLRQVVVGSTMGKIAQEINRFNDLKRELQEANGPSLEYFQDFYDESSKKLLTQIHEMKSSIQAEHIQVLNGLKDIAIDMHTFESFLNWNYSKSRGEDLVEEIDVMDYVQQTLSLGSFMFYQKDPRLDVMYHSSEKVKISPEVFRSLILFLARLFSEEPMQAKEGVPLVLEKYEKELRLTLPIRGDSLSYFYSTTLYQFFCDRNGDQKISLFQILNNIVLPINGRVVYTMKGEDVYIEIFMPINNS